MTLKRLLITGFVAFGIYLLIPFAEQYLSHFPLDILYYPLVILFFIYQGNKGKKYFLPLVISIASFYFTFLIPDLVMISFFSIGAIEVFYLLRFSAKSPKRGIDFMKLTLALIYGPGLIFIGFNSYEYLLIINFHIAAFASGFLILVIEKIRNFDMIKSRLRPYIIGFCILQLFFSLSFLIYAIIQKTEADKQRYEAVMHKELAEQEMRKAKEKVEYLKDRMKQLEDSLRFYKNK